MKRLSLLAAGTLALAACALVGCESAVPMGTPSDDAAAKAFSQPAPGRAAVYVYQEESGSTVLGITANQRVLGTLGRYSYLRTELPPGRYDLRAANNKVDVASLPIDLRPGEVRYVLASASVAPPAYSLREQPASVAQPAILAGKRVRDLKFLELPP
jgi:hypothetical protein